MVEMDRTDVCYYHGPRWVSTTDESTATAPSSTCTTIHFPERFLTVEVDPPPQKDPKEDEGYKRPNIHEFFRQLPKYSFKRPRIDAPLMTKVAHVQKSMQARVSVPMPKADNNNKHKEFFNRNAMVRVYCAN